jgi:hypothetical protein
LSSPLSVDDLAAILNVTREQRLDQVRAAIANLRAAEMVQFNPASTDAERSAARVRLRDLEHEFKWQWKNVAVLLEEMEFKR